MYKDGAEHSSLCVTPAILLNIGSSTPIVRRRVFNPVLPVLRITSTGTTIRFVGTQPHPLTTCTFANDGEMQQVFRHRIDYKTLKFGLPLNRLVSDQLPFNNIKTSNVNSCRNGTKFLRFDRIGAIINGPTIPSALSLICPPCSNLGGVLVSTIDRAPEIQ